MRGRSDLGPVLSGKRSWHVDGQGGEGALQGKGSAVGYARLCCNVHLERLKTFYEERVADGNGHGDEEKNR